MLYAALNLVVLVKAKSTLKFDNVASLLPFKSCGFFSQRCHKITTFYTMQTTGHNLEHFKALQESVKVRHGPICLPDHFLQTFQCLRLYWDLRYKWAKWQHKKLGFKGRES